MEISLLIVIAFIQLQGWETTRMDFWQVMLITGVYNYDNYYMWAV